NVNVSILNSTNNTIAAFNFTTNENGTFSSRSSFNTGGPRVAAPNQTGTYTIEANYTAGGALAKASFVVANDQVDDILFQLAKVNFYASENMSITVKSVRRVSGSQVAAGNITVNVTMRHINETIISSFDCSTSSAGTCTVNTTAPATSATYILEANNFVGFTNFKVVPFDVEIYTKDSSGIVFKNIFSKNEAGFVEIRVSFNSTAPAGTYNASGDVIDSDSKNVLNLSSVILNTTNGFVDKIAFTASSSLRVGFYTARISVRKEGGETVNATTTFQVRDWSMSFTKAAQGSGFEYGYTAFINRSVFFEAYPVERANGTVIQGLAPNFTVLLKNGHGSMIRNTTVRYNATCSAKACYEFNLTMPDVVGDYTLLVAANYSDDYQSGERTLRATDITATSYPSDSEGNLKELFGTTEFVFVSLSAKNITSNITATNAELSSITYENGTKLSYAEGTLAGMNFSDSALQWAWNASVSRLQLDPPKTGGSYIAEIYVNNKSVSVTTRFGVNPYDVCAAAKASSDTSTSDYWYQFRTSDTIYFQITISEAQNALGKAGLGNLSGIGSGYGRSSQCSFDTTKKRSVTNATVTVEKVFNTQSGKTETLNTSSSTCSATDNSGGYICTVQANDGAWDGGRHIVTFHIVGDDKITSHRSSGFFEARAFYLYGYSTNWANKANSSITLNLNAYEAGSGWWSSSNGLSGSAVVDSINYYGGMGEWIWPPIKYDYNVTGLNMTLTNGVGSVSLPATRSATGTWTGGYYSAVIKATVNDQVDFGEAWFSIRSWDAYASPVEISGNSFETKNSVNSRQNVSLYVRIYEAGNYNDFNGGAALGDVTIRVKKILDYSQWPPIELTSSNFTVTPITINASSPWYSSANVASHGKYLLNISPASGTWETGYYSVVLDLNGSETGYGYFNVISFYINTQPTNANGSGYVYNNKGNTPIYFNVTVTKSQKTSYNNTDYMNATITEAVLRMWDQVTQSQREFKYPGEINISPLLVNGSGIINVTYLAGNWPSGWYYGELKMRATSDNSTSKGYIWFSVQPFRVSTTLNSYNVGTRDNASLTLTIYEPDWASNAVVNGNYTITAVQETSWSGGIYRITNLNYSINNSAATFRNSTTLNINPTGGKWNPGYKSGTIIVKDNVTGDSQTAWFWFRVTSFTDAVTRTSGTNIGPTNNVTVNITLTTPAGQPATGNLSSAFYWGWPSKTTYRTVIGSCDSQTGVKCFINRSAIVTIVPPSSGWTEGYNYIYFEYIESDDASAVIESYNSIYFYVRQSLTGYMYSVNDFGNWNNKFGQADNVTMFVYSLQNLTGGTISVNVTNVQIAKTESSCWTESCRIYQNATFEVMNLTSGTFRNAGRRNMTSSGYIRINASGGSWELGQYAVKIFVTEQLTGETAIIKDATFTVTDKSPPSITITSPTSEQRINATSISLAATTTEQAVCYFYIYDYGQYDRYYCGGGNSTTPSACNATKYNNATSSYNFYGSKWSSPPVLTDSTSHSYNHSTAGMPTHQNYTLKLDCYDTDWNYATNATTFTITGLGSSNGTAASGGTLAINISSPLNRTYSQSTLPLSLSFSASNGTVSSCMYNVKTTANATGSNNTLAACNNITFVPVLGSNRLTIFTNKSDGSVSSASVDFTVHLFSSQVSIQSPTNTTYTTRNTTLNFTWTGNITTCRYYLNGDNFFGIPCANTTFSAGEGSNSIYVNASNSTGSNLSATIYFTADTTGPNVSFVAPTPASGAVLNVNHSYINITLNEAPNFIRLEFNGTNYTMTNLTQANLTWFRNQTDLAIGNYSYKVYANDTFGNMNATVLRTLRINATT
ncbi:MAG: hypothetical protein HY368_00285, partial [Candidatus Aenigmarchaeota archaeon]|nr:hypothetical protein [Candidatus Aenigmarchaeota archaeon]